MRFEKLLLRRMPALVDHDPVGGGDPGPLFRRMHALYQDFKRAVMRA